MSNPYNPSQPDPQSWGQVPYQSQPGQGYAANASAGGQDQWGGGQSGQQWNNEPYAGQQQAPDPQANQPWAGGQSWQQPAPQPQQPAPIDWSTAPPQPQQATWQGPSAFGSAPEAPAAPSYDQQWGSAQDAGQWQPQQPAAEYQPPAPVNNPAPPVAPPAQQEQWPSYNAPAQNPTINEAATVTTPAVSEQPPAEEPEALTIGRGRGNSIVLDDMLVSRQHVRITADADGLVLEDLGSRNGTYVNGRRVERTHLTEGDRIGIGAATFEVRDGWLLNV